MAVAVATYVFEHNNATNKTVVFKDFKDGVAFVKVKPGEDIAAQLLRVPAIGRSKSPLCSEENTNQFMITYFYNLKG